jgi:hypothetical protein
MNLKYKLVIHIWCWFQVLMLELSNWKFPKYVLDTTPTISCWPPSFTILMFMPESVCLQKDPVGNSAFLYRSAKKVTSQYMQTGKLSLGKSLLNEELKASETRN